MSMTSEGRRLAHCKAWHRRPRNGSSRCIDDELQVGIVIGLETGVRKTQHALLGMSQALHAARAAPDIVGFPPFCKFRAAVSKTGQQLDKRRIASPEIVCCTKLGKDALGLLGPA